MNYLEIAGTLIGIIYLWLEYKASAWLWIASIAMPAVYLVVYYQAGLYADFLLSVYYILASIFGLWCWIRKRNQTSESSNEGEGIIHTPSSAVWPLIICGLGVFIVIGFLLSRFTDSTVPWADGFTTALSITAMYMLAKKYVEQWLVWIVADMACAILYAYKDLWFTGGLYFAYSIVAYFGYRKWKRLMEKNE